VERILGVVEAWNTTEIREVVAGDCAEQNWRLAGTDDEVVVAAPCYQMKFQT